MNNPKNVPEIVRKIICVKPSNDFPMRVIDKYTPGIEPHFKNEPYVRKIQIGEIKNK